MRPLIIQLNDCVDEIFEINNDVFCIFNTTDEQKYNFFANYIYKLSKKNNTNFINDFNNFRINIVNDYLKYLLDNNYTKNNKHKISIIINQNITIDNIINIIKLCLELIRTYQDTTNFSSNNIDTKKADPTKNLIIIDFCKIIKY